MAAYEGGGGGGGGGGIGGKFRKRPFRRGPATPYARPPAVARQAQGTGWLSKLVDPASRVIAWSASRLFSSVFPKRLGAPPVAAPEANQKSMEEVLEEHCANSLHEVQEQQSDENNAVSYLDGGNAPHGTNPCVDGVSELEQLLKQKTFTRIEFDRLTQLLHSRTIEPSTPEVIADFENKEMANVPVQTNNKQQCVFEPSVLQQASSFVKKDKAVASEQEARGTFRSHGNIGTPVGLAVPKGEAASPTEIAKEYMSSRSFKVSPTALSTQNQLFQEDRALPSSTPYAKKLFDHSIALRSAVRISGPLEIRPHSHMSSKLHGRSAIYKMSRSPFFKPQSVANTRGEKLLVDGYGGPSTSQSTSAYTKSGGKQTLKRGSSVLDDDIGSFGPTRRTRRKSNLMSPLRNSYTSVGHFLPSSSTHVDRGPITSNQKLLHLNEQKSNHTELQAPENGGVPLVPIPPQSSEMAMKILQQLDKLAPSPKEKSSKLKIDMDKSPHMLTDDMLCGRALKSMEEIDTSKFLNVQRNGSLEDLIDSHQQRNFISLKQNEAEENGSTKNAIKGVQVTFAASVLEKPNISSTVAKPSVTTADFAVSGVATIPTRKPSFQMSAPEDMDELDDDSYDIKDSSSPDTIVGDKSELMSKVEIAHVENSNLVKSVESSSIGIHESTAILDRDPKKVPIRTGTEKMNGFLFPAVPASNPSQLPSMPPILATSFEKPGPQNEEVSAPTNKVGSEAQAFGSPSTAAGSNGLKFGASNATKTNVLEGSNSDKVGKTLKGGGLFHAFGNAALSGLSTSTGSGLSVFGVSTTSKLNDDTSSSTLPASSVPVAPAMTLDTSSTSGFSTSTGMKPSSAIAISSAAPAFSTISSFQSTSGVSLGASSAVISSTEKSDSANLIGESDKSSTFSKSSFATLGTPAALSSTGSNNSVLPTSSVFASMSSSSTALPASPLFSKASDSSAASMSLSFSTSSNGFFNFGASPQSSDANSLFFSSSSQNLTTFGGTAGSTFSTQPVESGSGMSNPLPSSSGTFGLSTPMTMFGLSGISSSGSASGSFGFSTPATKPLGSSSGFSFPSVTGSSSNSGSSSTFSFSSATVSSLNAGSSNSLVSTAPFGSSSFSFSTGSTTSTNSFVAGTDTALFGSSSQTSQSSSVSVSTFSSTTSSPATGFPFGSVPSSGSSPFTFGASSVPAFSFSSIGSTTSSVSPSPAQPVLGVPNQMAGLNSSPGNDQMNVEDSMADDPVQSSVPPAAAFGQPTNRPASSNFMFGSPAVPGGPSTFQFGSQQNNFIPQSPSPFQPAGNLEFTAGGSFSLGSGAGGDKSGRKIVRVRRDKLRKK